jgi:hypothetical protein
MINRPKQSRAIRMSDHFTTCCVRPSAFSFNEKEAGVLRETKAALVIEDVQAKILMDCAQRQQASQQGLRALVNALCLAQQGHTLCLAQQGHTSLNLVLRSLHAICYLTRYTLWIRREFNHE